MKVGLAPAALLLICACSGKETSGAAPVAPPPPPPAAGDAGGDTTLVVPPYPAGPYGIGLGNVMPDIAVQGYRLSRDNRDPKTLPFETIKLSELRADPTCENVLVLWDWAGAILTCTEMRASVVALVAKDPSFCALEIVAHAANSVPPDAFPWDVPPTRADVDDTVEESREPYPVGMSSIGVRAAGFEELPFFPNLFVMKKSDMKVAALIEGAGDTETRIRDAIAHPPPVTETLATDLDHPQGLVVDDTNAYLYDATLGVVRVPLAGGAPVAIDKPAAPPVALAQDATYVYWATNVDGATSEIARAPKTGGPAQTLTSGSSGYTSIALDGATIWLTRRDGFVGSVAATGGTETPLATGEASPTTIGVTATDAYWLAGGNVVSMPKSGGAKTTFFQPSDFSYDTFSFPKGAAYTFTLVGSTVRSDGVFVRFAYGPPQGSAGVVYVPFATPTSHRVFSWPYAVQSLALDPSGSAWFGGADGIGGTVMLLDTTGEAKHAALDFGQKNVGGVAVSATHGYWTDLADGKTAVLRRIMRP